MRMCRFIAVISSSFVILLLFRFPGWHSDTDNGSEVIHFFSALKSHTACAVAFASSLLLLLSSLWQHVAVVAYAASVDSLVSSAVKTDLGTTSIVILWVAFAIMTVVGLGLVVMSLSIQILDRIIDGFGTGTYSQSSPTIADMPRMQHTIQPRPPSMRQSRWDDGDE